jgi:putative transposase
MSRAVTGSYNAALEERREAWQKCGVSVTEAQQSAQLPAIKGVRPEFRDIHSQVLQDVLARLDRAFQAFFRRVKNGEKPGYPRFQGAIRFSSFTYSGSAMGRHWILAFWSFPRLGGLPCAGLVQWKALPRPSLSAGKRTGGMCLSPAPMCQYNRAAGQETGIDLGIEAFATPSEGARIFSPGWYRTAERALRTAQRRVSRRKKGSNRRRKAATPLAKAHQRVRRQRADFHHKTALTLIHANDTIYHEELQTANMVRNHRLDKSISNAGWARFLSILSDKAACAGRSVVAVPPAYTSQRCSGCGAVVSKGLFVRWHRCPDCGVALHRDHNAALNIERLGQSLRGGVAVVASENRESPAFMQGSVKCVQ